MGFFAFCRDWLIRRTWTVGISDRVSVRHCDNATKKLAAMGTAGISAVVVLGDIAQGGRDARPPPSFAEDTTPCVAILVTPSEIRATQMAQQRRAQHFWIDSSVMGDVLAGRRNVSMRTRRPMTLSANPGDSTMGLTLEDWYDQIGRPAEVDPPGRSQNYALPHSIGIANEIVALDKLRGFIVLFRKSQLAAQSLNDIWRRELHLPMFASTQTRPSLSDQIVIFGDGSDGGGGGVSRDGQGDRRRRRRCSSAPNPENWRYPKFFAIPVKKTLGRRPHCVSQASTA